MTIVYYVPASQHEVGVTGQVDARGRLLSVVRVREKAEALAALGVTTMAYPSVCTDVDLAELPAVKVIHLGFYSSLS